MIDDPRFATPRFAPRTSEGQAESWRREMPWLVAVDPRRGTPKGRGFAAGFPVARLAAVTYITLFTGSRERVQPLSKQ